MSSRRGADGGLEPPTSQSQGFPRDLTTGLLRRLWCEISENKNSIEPRRGPLHEVFGGGRTVGVKEIMELLDRILQLQKLTRSMIPSFMTHVDGLKGDGSSVPYLAKRPYEIPTELRDKVQHDL